MLQLLKDKLCITWSDSDTDRRLNNILNSAKNILAFKLGLPMDYMWVENTMESNLLLNYCFYEWNDAVDEFDNNYSNDILQIRMKYEVNSYVEEEEV